VDCIIFDNAPAARQRASRDGFEVASVLPSNRPIVVAAGQNQVEILGNLDATAYSLPEALYAFGLRNAYGAMHDFVHMVSRHGDELFARYQSIAPNFRDDFLSVLLYRSSLDVRHISRTRLPVEEMWTPPTQHIESFCDVGAYDGDTLRLVKSKLPRIHHTLTVEPNPHHVSAIATTAAQLKLENIHYSGASWSRRARLKADLLANGMFVMGESPEGDLAGETLDVLTSGATYDYIKFDVESTEKEALQGASGLLRRARCIAMAAYHLPNDLLDLPNQVDGIVGTAHLWRWGFRHYSQCFDDSIFYLYR
jgi:FkbM family methyltransferase